jgi:predicted phosphodiesterase
MKLREMSDLHLEFGIFDVPEIPNEKDIVLILAGDVGLVKKTYTFFPFIQEMSERHRAVLFVYGNHEYYKDSIIRAPQRVSAWIDHTRLNNVHILNNNVVEIDDVLFIGSTLWTDYNNANPISMFTASNSLTDFRVIRTGPPNNYYQRSVHPEEFLFMHRSSVKFIHDSLISRPKGSKRVVITHHAPSTLSIAPEYKDDFHLNGAYASNLENLILDTEPNLWFHGHTHTSFDYMIGDTRIVCNPRGYAPSDLNPTFDVNMVIDI